MAEGSDNRPQQAPKLEAGAAHDLAGLVDYAGGAVVSRTLADGNAGTLTLFAIDAGQRLSEHSTPFDAIVQVLDGEAELVIAGEVVVAGAGEVVVMPADVSHAVNAPRRLKMLLTMFRADRPRP